MTEQRYVAAIDQGTTSTRCMIFNRDGRVVAVDQKEHEQIFPRAGWVEHNAKEIWDNTREVTGGALAKADLKALKVEVAAMVAELERRGLAGFVVPRADEHQGEYVPACAERLAWLTGFTGSAGAAVILRDRAALVVDGRSAHAGRNPEDGRNALVAAADLALRLHRARDAGLLVNPARIDGGGPNNVVPAHAVLRVNFRPADADAVARARDAIMQSYVQLLRDVSPGAGSYMNEGDPGEPDWQQAFYGDHYERLLEIKQKYDPWSLFWAPTTVGSEGWEVRSVDGYPNSQNGRLCRTS